jgi:phosphoenolpyruvate carboxykinase (GTP)
MVQQPAAEPVVNKSVRVWLDECIALCQPDQVCWCNGTSHERQNLINQAVRDGILIKLNQEKLPGCYLHRSNQNDVARSEHLTFICTSQDMAGQPSNNWMESRPRMRSFGRYLAAACGGRCVIPFVMGPDRLAAGKSRRAIDRFALRGDLDGHHDPHGRVAWKQLGEGDEFTRCLHSIGDVNPDRRYICHFPLDNTIWSFGSGYGGNALLGKKCMALRIASWLGYQQEWMAEHMTLMGANSPTGEKTYVAAAFPSSCGKTTCGC